VRSIRPLYNSQMLKKQAQIQGSFRLLVGLQLAKINPRRQWNPAGLSRRESHDCRCGCLSYALRSHASRKVNISSYSGFQHQESLNTAFFYYDIVHVIFGVLLLGVQPWLFEWLNQARDYFRDKDKVYCREYLPMTKVGSLHNLIPVRGF